jgi:hypothetical protein
MSLDILALCTARRKPCLDPNLLSALHPQHPAGPPVAGDGATHLASCAFYAAAHRLPMVGRAFRPLRAVAGITKRSSPPRPRAPSPSLVRKRRSTCDRPASSTARGTVSGSSPSPPRARAARRGGSLDDRLGLAAPLLHQRCFGRLRRRRRTLPQAAAASPTAGRLLRAVEDGGDGDDAAGHARCIVTGKASTLDETDIGDSMDTGAVGDRSDAAATQCGGSGG